ncbi:MAG: bifunctional riboflavin kinase/FAD synthetase [Cytophagales bacterium]|nr:bifunctional riboflavin kinase/FAD synthetase [Cytophagales bacterium]
MKIIEDITQIEGIRNPVVTSGTFDGVHVGHQKILKRVTDLAKKQNGDSVVITYWPHPRFVLGKGWGDLRLLTTFLEKATFLADQGIDYLIKIPFTREFSEMSSTTFIQDIIINRIGTKKLVIGYDHKFGRNREGSFQFLQEHQTDFGFEIEEIPRLDIDDVGISSTKIRNALKAGQCEEAANFLGRVYSLKGIVIKGDQLGRTLGYPTANIYIAEEFKLIPSDGVYAVHVLVREKRYQGMLNIGIRPTVAGTRMQIEVNLFDFEQDIYGQNIQVEFVKMLRNEMKFPSKEALAEQLYHDKQHALAVLNP